MTEALWRHLRQHHDRFKHRIALLRVSLTQTVYFLTKILGYSTDSILSVFYVCSFIAFIHSLYSYCLSGNPILTPNAGYTKRVKPFVFDMLSSFSISDSSRLISLRFASMRAGVTDFARTEEPRATVPRNQPTQKSLKGMEV